jgi:hypothetical protein
MIYQEHEGAFEAEMKKYKYDSSNAAYTIEQLIRCNVLLKEQSDKQIEEKRIIRKKLLQIEKSNQNKDKLIDEKNQEIQRLNDTLCVLETNLKSTEEELKKSTKRNTALQNAIESPSCANGTSNSNDNLYKGFLKRLIHESPMPQFNISNERAIIDNDSIINDDNEIMCAQTQLDLNKLEEIENPICLSPVSRKRKNPFSTEELNKPKQNKFNLIEEFESKSKKNNEIVHEVLDDNADDDDDVQIVKPIEINTLKKISNKTLTKTKSNLYSYDGLGGRSKLLNPTRGESLSKNSKLTKSKVTSISPFLVKKL